MFLSRVHVRTPALFALLTTLGLAAPLSAFQVQTDTVANDSVPAGRASVGYDSNLGAREVSGTLWGRGGGVSYRGHGAWRDSGDYTAGTGERVPGDFRSWEARGKVGLEVSERSRLAVSAGYREQGPSDYPGRLLNTNHFETLSTVGRWETERPSGTFRRLDVVAYRNEVSHGMGNWGKPTAEPMQGRVPPYALDIEVASSIHVRGARAAADLERGPWSLRVGSDVYSATRDAVRTIRRRSDDRLFSEDLMWPDATITEGGLSARASRSFASTVRLAGTLRLDLVRAEADTASEFFLEDVSTELGATEAHLSAAATVGIPLGDRWDLSVGLGSEARTADVSERYSDRIPAGKSQISAEFVGSPGLAPERSTQLDLWLEGRLSETALQLNLFGRKLQDHITIEATDLPKRLPQSPEPVFRYVNRDATFWGGEASAVHTLGDALTVEVASSYLWAHDDELDEPVLGIAPLSGRVGLRYGDPTGRYHLGGTARMVTSQQRVASTLGEMPTDGYGAIDLRAGWAPGAGVTLRAGIENLLDEGYATHLNAKNAFTGQRIPEPGRVLFARVSYEL